MGEEVVAPMAPASRICFILAKMMNPSPEEIGLEHQETLVKIVMELLEREGLGNSLINDLLKSRHIDHTLATIELKLIGLFLKIRLHLFFQMIQATEAIRALASPKIHSFKVNIF